MPREQIKNISYVDRLIARWMLIIRPAVVTATLGVAMLILPRGMVEKTPIEAVVFGTYVLTLLYWFAHSVSGVSHLLLVTQIAFDVFIITVIIHIFSAFTGSYDSSFVGFYLLSIMCSSLFFGRLVTMLISTQAAVFYGVYLLVIGPLLEPSLFPENMRQSIVLQVVLYSILMYGVGFLSSYYTVRLKGKDTALTNALKLLKEAKLDTWDILQSMTNGLITVDISGRIMYMNNVAEKILQTDHGSAVGEKYVSVFGSRVEELAKVLKQQLTTASNVSEKEIEIFNKEGAAIPLGLSSMPLYDIDGSRHGVIVNFKDLTEKNKLLEMLRQSERMAAIGELSAAIAHEIRNPLASISNAVEILFENFEVGDSQDSRLLNVIEKESGRLQQLSSDFLHFARMKTPEIESLALGKVVEDVLILIDNDPRKTENITIKNSIDSDTNVLFDTDQLRQLILNVLINSLEALEGSGWIEICVQHYPDSSESFARLIISDNGPGFPQEALGCMFEPFFSTKKDGTGLGLALVRKIAVSNNGRVFARNRERGGAEVILDMCESRALPDEFIKE